MTAKIIKRYIFFVVVFFTWALSVHADFEITEIMYDQEGTDTNREWVEVQNTNGIPEDLSKWFLFSDNTKHKLISQSESIVPPGSYVVIAQNVPQFNIDYPNFQGLLFDSSWTGFKNESDYVSLKDPNLNIISPVSYTSGMDGAGNGNSLSKIDGTWQNGIPTPGKDNVKAVPKPIAEKSTQKSSTVAKENTPIIYDNKQFSQIIDLNDLDTNTENKKNIPDIVYPLGLAAIIGTGIGSFSDDKKEK